MDSFELNKIIGAILGTLLFVMGVGFLAEGIYAPITNNGPSYDLPEPAAGAAATTAAAAPAVPLADLLAKADPQQGASSAKKCQSCHDFTEGGPNKTGPNLYDVVGRKIASHPNFSYSEALLAHAADSWTYENLDKWLTSPKAYAPGTKMTFVGIDDPVERSNVIAYLRTLSKNPVPFPAPAPAAAPAATPETATPTGGSTVPAAGTATPTAAPATTTSPAGGPPPAPAGATAPAPTSAPPAATPTSPAATAPAADTTAPAASTAPAADTAAPAATTTPAPATTAPAASATPAPATTTAPAPAATAAPAAPAATTSP